jgi:DNA-binding transcriptional LysR family regulator
MSTAIGLVRAGLGIAILPSTAIELRLETELPSLSIQEPILHRSITLVLKVGRSLPPAAEALRDMLIQKGVESASVLLERG